VVGGLWLAAGLLQLQPFMFTPGFAADVLGSASSSQPRPLQRTITTVEQLVAAQPAMFNTAFALTELLVGATMILATTGALARHACRASIAFGLGVWAVGEGAGGLLTGHAAITTGAPGAAALYVMLTVAAWPRPVGPGVESPLPAVLLTRTWLLVWLTGTVLAVLPAQWGAAGLGGQASMGWMMSPRWAVAPTLGLAHRLQGLDRAAAAALCLTTAALLAAVAVGVLCGGTLSRCARAAGVALALSFWMFGQGFGGLSTGTATDVGTAPLLVVLAVACGAAERAARHDEPTTPAGRSYGHETSRSRGGHRRNHPASRRL
jgi:hypothetical protein